MKRKIKSYIYTFSIVLFLLFNYSAFATTEVITGYFGYVYPFGPNNFDYFYPLFLISEDNGLSWSYVPSQHIQLPKYVISDYLNSSTCSGNLCIASGNYFENYAVKSSVLLMSTDQGHNWSYQPIVNLPEGASMDLSDCNENTCVVTGNSNQGPLIISSLDKGKTWVARDVAKLPSLNVLLDGGGLSCTLNSCAAGGSYYPNKNSNARPFIATSMDKGKTWSSVKISNPPSKGGLVVDMLCSSSTCVAAGVADNIPELYVGGGDSNHPWVAVTPTNLPANSSGQLDSVAHIGNNWIASGFYTTQAGGTEEALLVSSNDNGHSWTTISLANIVPTDATLSRVYCSDSICLAIGKYTVSDPFQQLPLILISHDAGQTWSVVKNISEFQKIIYLYLKSVKCIGSICTIIGYSSGSSADHPFILSSRDNGQSWTVIPDTSITKLPTSGNAINLTDIGGEAAKDFIYTIPSMTSHFIRGLN